MRLIQRLSIIGLILIGSTVGTVSSAQAEVTAVNTQEDIEQAVTELSYTVVVSYALAEIATWDQVIEDARISFINSIPKPMPVVTRPAITSSPARTSGGHSDRWWQGVAQCEQGGRNDPYYGYFSFMDGSQGGKPWADQVAAGNALLARVSSESPAWAPSCVAMGYQYSPNG